MNQAAPRFSTKCLKGIIKGSLQNLVGPPTLYMLLPYALNHLGYEQTQT